MRCLTWAGTFAVMVALLVIVGNELGIVPALLLCVGLYFTVREGRIIQNGGKNGKQ